MLSRMPRRLCEGCTNRLRIHSHLCKAGALVGIDLHAPVGEVAERVRAVDRRPRAERRWRSPLAGEHELPEQLPETADVAAEGQLSGLRLGRLLLKAHRSAEQCLGSREAEIGNLSPSVNVKEHRWAVETPVGHATTVQVFHSQCNV